MTTPTEPTTEAGRTLLDIGWRSYEHFRKSILAIEAEARSTPSEALDVERLAQRLLEGQRRQGGSVPLTNEYEARAYAAWLLGASDEAAAEYAGLRDKEER